MSRSGWRRGSDSRCDLNTPHLVHPANMPAIECPNRLNLEESLDPVLDLSANPLSSKNRL
jgi:hypothetical protein